MVVFRDWDTRPHPLAQLSPMVWRIMATVACPSLRSGLRLHFCHGPLICSAPLHPLHLFSILSPKRGIKSHEKKIIAALLVIPSVTRDLTNYEDLPCHRRIGRFLDEACPERSRRARNDNCMI